MRCNYCRKEPDIIFTARQVKKTPISMAGTVQTLCRSCLWLYRSCFSVKGAWRNFSTKENPKPVSQSLFKH